MFGDDLAHGEAAGVHSQEKRYAHPNKIGPRSPPARTDWRRVTPAIDPARFVLLDERGVATDLLRRYGRSQRGTRVHEHTPHHHGRRAPFVAALRLTGLTAPTPFDVPMDGECFLAYVDQILSPTLQAGDIRRHAQLGGASRSRAPASGSKPARAALVPAPDTPDLSPIELWFAKVKALLRTVRRRTVEELWDTFGACLALFSAVECRNYFRHFGYAAATQSQTPLNRWCS